MMNALTALFVKRFYRLNAGFFLVCFFILFGIFNFRDMVYFHYSIMEQAYTPQVMLLLMLAWLLYNFKCFGFVNRTLQTLAHTFLYQLQGLNDKKLMTVFSYLQLLVYLPALAYALVTSAVLLSHGKLVAGLALIFYQGLMIMVPALLYRIRVNGTFRQSAVTAFFQKATFCTGSKRFSFWLLHYLAHQRKSTLLGIKTGSLILLQAMLAYNKTNLNLESVCFLMMGLIGVHAVLPYYIREFAEERLAFVRSMPLSLWRRFAWHLLTYALLMLPELLFLLLHLQNALAVGMIIAIYLVTIAQLCLYSSLLYLPRVSVENYMFFVIALFLLSLLVLAAFPVWYFAAGTFAVSAVLFTIFYERWEAVIES